MRIQVHDRRPAARHGDHVAIYGLPRGAVGLVVAQDHTLDMLGAFDLGDGGGGQDGDARGPRGLGQRAVGGGARVDDGRDLQPRGMRGQGGAIGVVVVRDHDDAPPRCHSVIGDEIANRAGQHHARHVVAGKGQRAFQRAGRGDHPARPDAPEALAGDALVRVVIGQRFPGDQIAVIVKAGGHGVATQGDRVAAPQIGQSRVDRRLSAVMIGGRTPAPMPVLLQDQHGAARRCRVARGGQTRDAAADDDRVGKGVSLFIAVGIGIGRRPAQTRAAADDGFKQVFPEGARMDEGLVVETSRKDRRQPVVHRADIGLQAGPAVLAAGDHAVGQGRGRGALVRFEPPALAQAQQGVRFLGARGDGAARAVVLEGPAHQQLAVGQQRRSDGVAGQAAQVAAVKAERDLPGTVDAAATGGQAKGGRVGHSAMPSAGVQSGVQSGRALRIASTMSAGGCDVCAR